ncbi:hypothetical protein DASC09_056630 [Saccharomycopsis crataegensis]|uniref:Major facilitator superfamily (MFS) profile domain-containing protein n=1 Tax=Saccharomycopsis crataegensis TaxID=43959 RepID=A0AAV5QUY9_9ASCO|nr:hypothetical protein DASC09_056630 [Saccharomycopsis crataegensis]
MPSAYQKALDGPKFKSSVIKHYAITRFTNLIPRKEHLVFDSYFWNPFKPLTQLNARQWNLFFAGFWCWTWDAFDYFSVSLNVSALAEQFDVKTADVTWGITLVLMLRSVGAAFFGILSDRYGRRIPLAASMICLTILQIGLGFVNTYQQFLGVRAMFGIFMGGIFGPAYAIALENAPDTAHGILSGIFQEGYAFGYLLVVCFQRAITDNSSHSWRALFWFSAGPSVLFAIWVLLVGESDSYLRHVQLMNTSSNENASKRFINQGKMAFKRYWVVCIYLVLLMTGFNFSSHGSQDLYPTLLTKQLGYGVDRSTVTNSVANLGAIAGGLLFGHLSNYIGRRMAIIICCIGGGAMIYPWAFVRNSGINAGVFFLQFFVQGAWGVAPIVLAELSPPEFRSFVGGLAYQLGNLVSSASSTIEATIGERFPIYDADGQKKEGVYNYSKVMAIFMGCVFGYLLLITFVGPENIHADLSYKDEENDNEKNDDSNSLDVKGDDTEYLETV